MVVTITNIYGVINTRSDTAWNFPFTFLTTKPPQWGDKLTWGLIHYTTMPIPIRNINMVVYNMKSWWSTKLSPVFHLLLAKCLYETATDIQYLYTHIIKNQLRIYVFPSTSNLTSCGASNSPLPLPCEQIGESPGQTPEYNGYCNHIHICDFNVVSLLVDPLNVPPYSPLLTNTLHPFTS